MAPQIDAQNIPRVFQCGLFDKLGPPGDIAGDAMQQNDNWARLFRGAPQAVSNT
jgi:hypothetical protein